MSSRMDIDAYVEMRGRCFALLEQIAEQQMKIAKNVADGRNVTDWNLYLQKQNVRLKALSDAKSTLDTIIKNIDKHGNIEESLKRIEDALQLEEQV